MRYPGPDVPCNRDGATHLETAAMFDVEGRMAAAYAGALAIVAILSFFLG